jgi:manganese/zinc/iron transport system substrate-binding protein
MKTSKRLMLLCLLSGLGMSVVGCKRKGGVESGLLKVVATTTMVADMVKAVGGDAIKLKGLMRPGVDPHLYEPVPSDGIALKEADVVFYSGLFLEGQMHDRLKGLGEKSHSVTSAIDESNLLKPGNAGGHPDPHVWGDVALWEQCVAVVVNGLSKASPENTEKFRLNGETYKANLADLHQWARARADEVPKEKRILVTSHDAFSYFGRAYGFDVIGLQGISTISEVGSADRVKMVDLIKERGIKAIFVESSVSPAAIKSISADSGAEVGGELFSDALGTPGKMESLGGETYDVGTYVGMIKHNMNTAVEALK